MDFAELCQDQLAVLADARFARPLEVRVLRLRGRLVGLWVCRCVGAVCRLHGVGLGLTHLLDLFWSPLEGDRDQQV